MDLSCEPSRRLAVQEVVWDMRRQLLLASGGWWMQETKLFNVQNH